MVIDTSAVVAILNQEAEAGAFARLIADQDEVSISAASVVEAEIVLGRGQRATLDDFLRVSGAVVAPVGPDQAETAREAHRAYGRGSGSRARLDFGDCFSYALAKQTGQPLLFKGDDFAHTDVEPAWRP
jgi:ribonuclease VapC